MKKALNSILHAVSFLLLIVSTSLAQDGQTTINVTVEDDYTGDPVESVLVRLLDGGSEIASGTTDLTGRAELVLSLTSVDEPSVSAPESFQVSESYPNPFEQSSSVNLQIDEAQDVQAEIFNIIGQRVAQLQVNLTPGTYTLQSSLGHLAQGVYFLRILGTQTQTIKMTKVGERIFSGGSILNITPATFATRTGPGMAGLTVDGHSGRSLTLVTSNGSYDTYQQSLQVAADTSLTVAMSRNNEVIVRVADESSPTQDVETTLMVEGDNFSQQITSPDTLTLKSGIYTLSADDANTAAFSQQVEIASEDQTVTVLTQVKTLADNQLQLEGLITDESTTEPISRAYVYLLNQTTSDTLVGPLFAGSDGVLDAIASFDNGPDLDLSILYRKSGYTDVETTTSVSLPDTLDLTSALQPAPAPTASFTVTGEQRINTPLIFDASASAGAAGEDLVYFWDFGNGKRGFGRVISFVYADNGSYDVTLTVSGEFGASGTATERVSINRPSGSLPSTIINGEITALDQTPLEGVTAQVVFDDRESTSGTDGRIIIPDIPAGAPIVVKLTKEGYATQTVRITPDGDSDENYFTTSMIPLEEAVTIPSIEAGTDMTGKYGTRVSLPVDALVDANGDVVTGDVELSMTPLDVSSDEIFAFPGGFDGLRSTGEQGQLVSYGVADYTFTQNGKTLQMMPGKSAEIEIPVTNADVEVGDQIPLWTLDEETGLWIEEGSGEIISSTQSPTGLAMTTTTGHFSWKNIDVFFGGTGIDEVDTYTLIPNCRNSETGENISCSIRGTLFNEDGSIAGYAPTIVVPVGSERSQQVPVNRRFELLGYNGEGGLSGTAEIPPVSDPNEVIRVTIDLSPRVTSDAILIEYGDALKGRSTISETTRYKFEAEQDDYIRIQLREGVGFEGVGTVTLYHPNGDVLEQNEYRNSYTRYIFETIPQTGTYFIDVEAETSVSNFDIELDLFPGSVNRQISYGDRIFDFLWPGTTNTYTFDGQTEDVIELIARSVQGEGSLFGKLKLITPNPLVSDSTTFFDYNAWVYKLNEKDGIYEIEVSGAEMDRFGEYILEFDTVDNFRESGSEIVYGDSILVKATNADPINSFTFEGSAGDRIRLHFDKPYPDEDENIYNLTNISLLAPDSEILYEFFNSFRFFDNSGFGYILPIDGTYTVNMEADRIDTPDAEGDLASLVLKKFENLNTINLDDGTIDFRNEVFDNGLNLYEYTFTGEGEDFSRLVTESTDGGSRSEGIVLIFDENNQFLSEGRFSGARFGDDSIIDLELSDQEYIVLVLNPQRVKESFGRLAYGMNLQKGDRISVDEVNTVDFSPNESKSFFFENTSLDNEFSIAVVFENSSPFVSVRDPENESVTDRFGGRMTTLPSILESLGTHQLSIRSISNIPETVAVSVVDLEAAETFQLESDQTVSLNGSIRINGDIDRFDFTADTDGTIKLSLLPSNENSIDDTGNLNIQLRNLSQNNNPVQANNSGASPPGDEIYIWEGDINASENYRVNILEQAVLTTGNFILNIDFTPDS